MSVAIAEGVRCLCQSVCPQPESCRRAVTISGTNGYEHLHLIPCGTRHTQKRFVGTGFVIVVTEFLVTTIANYRKLAGRVKVRGHQGVKWTLRMCSALLLRHVRQLSLHRTYCSFFTLQTDAHKHSAV